MKKLLFTLMLIFSVAGGTFARVSDTISISEGNQKSADRGKLTVKFVSIIEDSRCPMNAKCVWAGNAKIKLAISKGKAAPKMIELNTNTEPSSVKIFGYQFRLEGMTQKNPESMEMMDRPKVATISVSKVK